MSSTLTNLTAATTWSGTDLFYALVGGNSRKIAASSLLVTDAANVLSDVNSTNAQTFRVYRTFTDSSNYERLALQSGSGYMEIAAETAGTGTDEIDLRLTPSGSVGKVTTAGGLGYGTGAGSSVTQTTSKSTSVSCPGWCGQITMHNAALAAGAVVGFFVANSRIGLADSVICTVSSGAFTGGSYSLGVSKIEAPNFEIWVRNDTAGSLSEALVINFAIIKGVTS